MVWPTHRFNNYKNQPLQYSFPKHFTGKLPVFQTARDNRVQKRPFYVKKEVTLSVKWPMPCIWLGLMLKMYI